MILVVWLACIVCGVWVQWMWRRRRMVRVATLAPQYPGCLPILGHALIFLMKSSEEILKAVRAISETALQNGGVTVLWLRFTPHFLITNPKDAALVLNSCLEKSYMYCCYKPWLGDGLLTAKPSRWIPHRRLLNPAFNLRMIDSFLSVFDRQSRKLADILQDYAGVGYFDVSKYIFFNALETICENAIGVPADGIQEVDECYAKASSKVHKIIMTRMVSGWLHIDSIFNFTKMKKEQDELVEFLHGFSENVIRKRKIQYKDDHLESTGHKFKPFLQLMMDLQATKGVFTDREIREQVDTIIAAGHETSALVLLYVFINVGSYPRIQEKIYKELYEIFGDTDRDVTKDDLTRMSYLEAVVNETLRKFPIVHLVARDVLEDLELSNCTLPAGSSCYISVWGLHHGPEWGPDPHEFRPERWLDPASLPKHPASFAGFSFGKRMCIGKSYAMMSMKTTVAHILRRYKVTADVTKLQNKIDILLRPVSGHHIAIEPRDNSNNARSVGVGSR